MSGYSLLPYYPVEKNTLRFYKYQFYGYAKPIIIEAYNKIEARQKLSYLIDKFNLHNVEVIGESLTLPIIGTTTKMIDDVENVWVGNMTPTCWMPTEEFEKLNIE